MSAPILNVGDVAVVGVKVSVDGALTSPSALVAYVTRPDGVTRNSTDHPTEVAVTIGLDGSTALPAELASDLDVTTAQNEAGDGLAKVQFRTAINDRSTLDAAGTWRVTVVHSGGGADGVADRAIEVRRPAAPFRWTSGVTIS